MRWILALLALLIVCPVTGAAQTRQVRIKDLGRFEGWRDNPLVGYGVVTGLGGSGDSPGNEVTRQALKNVLGRLGANIAVDQVRSRNVAVVMVVATLPPSATVGDKIDVNVTSIGDASSLAGGTLLLTPLMGPNQHVYALAQGPLVVGGFRFSSEANVEQKNSPTAGDIPGGASVEESVSADVQGPNGLTFLLKDPDYTTSQNVADAINLEFGQGLARPRSAEAIAINASASGDDIHRVIARIENLGAMPDQVARVVVNERAGTVVAGGGARLSDVVIAQGDIRVSVQIDQDGLPDPLYLGGLRGTGGGGSILTTKLTVDEGGDRVVNSPGASVADLVQALHRAHVSTRTMIAILQAIKGAGALHAELIVQ